jgi:hypothetical protein
MCVNKTFFLRISLFFFLYANATRAQKSFTDSVRISLAGSYPVKQYYDAIGENAHVYNGYEYFTPDRNIKGSPYFLSDSPVPSTFIYDDSYYQNFPVLYDQVRDLVVINRLGQNFRISLINSKLNSFTFRNHEFVRLSGDTITEKHGPLLVNGYDGSAKSGVSVSKPTTSKRELSTGFYDRIYAGRTAVYVRRKKYVKEVLEYSNVNTEYLEEYTYFIFFEGGYKEVENKSDVFKLFKSKKSEIKSYLRKNKLNFKSDFEKTLVATSAYYDQLTS